MVPAKPNSTVDQQRQSQTLLMLRIKLDCHCMLIVDSHGRSTGRIADQPISHWQGLHLLLWHRCSLVAGRTCRKIVIDADLRERDWSPIPFILIPCLLTMLNTMSSPRAFLSHLWEPILRHARRIIHPTDWCHCKYVAHSFTATSDSILYNIWHILTSENITYDPISQMRSPVWIRITSHILP